MHLISYQRWAAMAFRIEVSQQSCIVSSLWVSINIASQRGAGKHVTTDFQF